MDRILTVALAWAAFSSMPISLMAQTQTWQRRNAPPPAGAQVVPENCRTESDGSLTCGTRLEGDEGRRPAAPRIELFPN